MYCNAHLSRLSLTVLNLTEKIEEINIVIFGEALPNTKVLTKCFWYCWNTAINIHVLEKLDMTDGYCLWYTGRIIVILVESVIITIRNNLLFQNWYECFVLSKYSFTWHLSRIQNYIDIRGCYLSQICHNSYQKQFIVSLLCAST